MPTPNKARLLYGHRKYAALHLMYSRLIRIASDPSASYVYVTLGGTEFRDVQSLRFIDAKLASRVISFEGTKDRHQLATATAAQLNADGVPLTLFNKSFFDYEREDDLPHIFFLDLEGICAFGGYDEMLGQMFQDEAIREGDLLLITSALGRDPGTKEIMKIFAGEYSVLNITTEVEARKTYRRSHPSFTLYKGLNKKGLSRELRIRCLGCIKYRDPSRYPMGIYGYSILKGVTDFRQLINDPEILYYDMNAVSSCDATNF